MSEATLLNAGWEACLDRLEDRAGAPPWKQRFEHYSAAFEPVLGHQDGPPDGYRGKA